MSNFKAVATARYHCLALLTNGTVWKWGATGGTEPAQVEGLSGVNAVGAGPMRSFAIKDDGTTWAWGAEPLGDGGSRDSYTPVQVQCCHLTTVDSGMSHSISLRNDGVVFTWGYKDSGQIGTGSTSAYAAEALSDVKAIPAGNNFCLAGSTPDPPAHPRTSHSPISSSSARRA